MLRQMLFCKIQKDKHILKFHLNLKSTVNGPGIYNQDSIAEEVNVYITIEWVSTIGGSTKSSPPGLSTPFRWYWRDSFSDLVPELLTVSTLAGPSNLFEICIFFKKNAYQGTVFLKTMFYSKSDSQILKY